MAKELELRLEGMASNCTKKTQGQRKLTVPAWFISHFGMQNSIMLMLP